MTLEGQVDCRTPRTLQAGSGAPHLSFASQGQPGVRVLLPRTVGKTTPAPRPCTAPAWGNGGPVGPLAAPLLSPTWAESHRTSQGPGRDASRAAMTPWAEHEKSALCFWSLLPLPLQALCPGLVGHTPRSLRLWSSSTPGRAQRGSGEVSWGRPPLLRWGSPG